MSRSARRFTSWLGLFALATLAAAAYRALPGADGLTGEVRWLLARDSLSPDLSRSASRLLLHAEVDAPGSTAPVFRTLLRDADPRVVAGTLPILTDQLRFRDVRPRLLDVARDWLANATAAQLQDNLPASASLGGALCRAPTSQPASPQYQAPRLQVSP